MRYLLSKGSLGSVGAALIAQLSEVQGMTALPPLPLVAPPQLQEPSPTKAFSNRGLRRHGITAAQRKAKRRAQKAARRRNRDAK